MRPSWRSLTVGVGWCEAASTPLRLKWQLLSCPAEHGGVVGVPATAASTEKSCMHEPSCLSFVQNTIPAETAAEGRGENEAAGPSQRRAASLAPATAVKQEGGGGSRKRQRHQQEEERIDLTKVKMTYPRFWARRRST